MKRSPIVTTRDPRLSLWTSIVESQMKEQNPDMSIKDIRNLPQMRGVFAHVAEASGSSVPALNPAEQEQKAKSETMYKSVSAVQFNSVDDIVNLVINLAKLVDTGDYSAFLDEYGIRLFSDKDYANWAAVAVNWVVAVNARDFNADSTWEKIKQGIKDFSQPVRQMIVKWCGQASDTRVQQLITYRGWSNHGQNYSVVPWVLPNNAKVVMLGDWGTSLDDAKQLLKAIWIQENPNAFVHLGDIYYSGTQEECNDNFLQVFKEVAKELGKSMVPVFTIPGNHEYYSFGDGFYWLIDNINKNFSPNPSQQASYFCLRTQDSKWQFLAMDTGQDDNNPIVTALDSFAPKLMGDRGSSGELAWHMDKLKNFAGNTILMSHHQLFSRNAAIDEKVTPYFSRYLHSYFSPFFNKIAAWFWGHEHSFAIYQDGIYGLAKGRLLGSSSYEEATSNNPYVNNYPLAPYAQFNQPNHSNGYYDHICAVFDFTRTNPGDPITVSYYTFPSWGQEDSMPSNAALGLIYQETIGASGMKGQTWSGNNKISDGNIECQNTPGLCFDGTNINMAYRNTNDNLHYAKFDPGLNSIHNSDLNINTSHSPTITEQNGTLYIAFSYQDDNNNLCYITYSNGNWSNATYVEDSNKNKKAVGSGISSVWLGSDLYIAFVQDGTDNICLAKLSGGHWSYITPPGSPESDDLGPALAVSNGILYLIYADKNNHNRISYMTYNGSGWTQHGLVCNGTSNSTADMAYAQAHDNISACTEPDGKVTAVYRAGGKTINWLTYDPGTSLWTGGVSLPRIKDDTDVPMTSESAGVTGLSDGIYLAFRGKSTNDVRWVRRQDQ